MTESQRQHTQVAEAEGQEGNPRGLHASIERARQLTKMLIKHVTAMTEHNDLFEQLGEMFHAPDVNGRDRAYDAFRQVISRIALIDQAMRLAAVLTKIDKLERDFNTVEAQANKSTPLDEMLKQLRADLVTAGVEGLCWSCGRPRDGVGPAVSPEEISRRLREARLARRSKEENNKMTKNPSASRPEVERGGDEELRRRPHTEVETLLQVIESLTMDLSAMPADDHFERIGEIVYAQDESGRDKAWDAYRRVIEHPAVVDQAKKATDALAKILKLSRERVELDDPKPSIDEILINLDPKERTAKLENVCASCGKPLDEPRHP